jgi:hypothetical protein
MERGLGGWNVLFTLVGVGHSKTTPMDLLCKNIGIVMEGRFF